LLVLFGLKTLATALTLGSGGSGGIFSPSLFLGATFGAAYGVLLKQMFPGLPISPPAFAVVGMAGMVGGTTGAAITAIVIIFEMTLDYNVILPMTITVAISYGVRTFLTRHSIYTLKLARRGHHMPEALQANFHFLRMARDLMEERIASVQASTPLGNVDQSIFGTDHTQYLLVEAEGKLVGVIERQPVVEVVARQGNGAQLGDLVIKDYEVVNERTTLFELLTKLRAKPVSVFLVATKPAPVSITDVKGVISKQRIADSMTESLGLFTE